MKKNKKRLTMRTLAVTTLLLASASSATAATGYPTAYPFKSEASSPPTLPETEPYDVMNGKNGEVTSKDNPGGYIARFAKCDPFSEDRLGIKFSTADLPLANDFVLKGKYPGFLECRGTAFLFMKLKAAKVSSENCTGAQIIEPSKFTGKVNGKAVCTSCCEAQKGFVMEPAEKYAIFEGEISTVQSTGSCPMPNEATYCTYITFKLTCLQALMGEKGDSRRQTWPCYDSQYNWLSSCPTFKANKLYNTLTKSIATFEHENYVNKLTAVENLVLNPLMKQPDRVCHPYSYYYPATKKSDGSSTPTLGGLTAGLADAAKAATAALAAAKDVMDKAGVALLADVSAEAKAKAELLIAAMTSGKKVPKVVATVSADDAAGACASICKSMELKDCKDMVCEAKATARRSLLASNFETTSLVNPGKADAAAITASLKKNGVTATTTESDAKTELQSVPGIDTAKLTALETAATANIAAIAAAAKLTPTAGAPKVPLVWSAALVLFAMAMN